MLLQDYRKKLGLSQQKAAKQMGVNWITIYRWETGRSIPEPTSIRKIQEWSGGHVTANDFIKAEAKPA